MRTRVLFFPFDLLSHYLRCLSLAKGIEKEVEVLFPYSNKYDSHCREAGISTFPYKGPPVELVMQSAKRFHFSWIKKDLLEEQFLEQVHIIQTLKPKVVIGDATFTLRMAAAYTHTPFISIVNGYMTAYYQPTRRLPPTHPISRVFAFLPRACSTASQGRPKNTYSAKCTLPFENWR